MLKDTITTTGHMLTEAYTSRMVTEAATNAGKYADWIMNNNLSFSVLVATAVLAISFARDPTLVPLIFGEPLRGV
jgi:hypothetical protein